MIIESYGITDLIIDKQIRTSASIIIRFGSYFNRIKLLNDKYSTYCTPGFIDKLQVRRLLVAHIYRNGNNFMFDHQGAKYLEIY